MRSRHALALLLFLAACGGGGGSGVGGGGAGSGSPANRPPAITSPAVVSIVENTTGTAYQATAADPDGNPVTFRIGGTDAARFSITQAGALSFVPPADFENPTDANADNVYQLILVAIDSFGLETGINFTVTVTNTPDIAMRRISGFSRARLVAAVPGSTNAFVSESDGDIYLTNPSQAGPGTLYLDAANVFVTGSTEFDPGVLGLVAAPDYATSGIIYLMVSTSTNVELRRYGRLPSGLGDPASADVILRLPWPPNEQAGFGGGLAFGPDGFLYVGTADTTPGNQGVNGAGSSAQDVSSLNGKILRLDVSRDDFPADPLRDYGIPASNPFAGGGGAGEVYARGLENPREISFDGANLFIADAHRINGLRQEIHMLRPQDAGANFGFYGIGSFGNQLPGSIPPIIFYESDSPFPTGGANLFGVYRGPVVPLRGLIFFSDRYNGPLWSVPLTSVVQGSTITEASFTQQQGAVGLTEGISRFGTDAQGNLYIVPRQSSGDHVLLLEIH